MNTENNKGIYDYCIGRMISYGRSFRTSLLTVNEKFIEADY